MKNTVTTEAPETTPRTRSQSWSVNQVKLVGRLATEPSRRDTTAGLFASLRIATNSTRFPEFHDVVLWGKDAARCVQDLTKGQAVQVEGRLRTRTWTSADGTSRRTTEVVAFLVVPVEADVQ
jgi:single-strand DNA-binding protein